MQAPSITVGEIIRRLNQISNTVEVKVVMISAHLDTTLDETVINALTGTRKRYPVALGCHGCHHFAVFRRIVREGSLRLSRPLLQRSGQLHPGLQKGA